MADVGSSDGILVEVESGVATVTLNRPDRLNALTDHHFVALRELVEQLGADPGIRVVVLTGAGRAFCAGGDVETLSNAELTGSFVRSQARVVEALYNLEAVTVAAVNGACAGGGMALACATDLRLAGESAFFTSAFLRVGTTGDMGLPWHLVRLVGFGKAKELCLLGERTDANEAVRIGLANRVVADSDLRRSAHDIATRLAGFAPLATAGLKRNLNDAAIVDFPTFLDVESARFGENAKTADSTEAVRAFIEKRSPLFHGR